MTSKTILTLFAAAMVGVTLFADTPGSGHGNSNLPMKRGQRLKLDEDTVQNTREPASELDALSDEELIKELQKAIDSLPEGGTKKLGEVQSNQPMN